MNLTDLVQQHLPNKRKVTPSGSIMINCPMCRIMGQSRNDTRFRCGFTRQADKGFVVHCYNCHFATRWIFQGRVSKNMMKFLRQLGIDSRQIPIGLRLLRTNETLDKVKFVDTRPEVVLEFDEVKLPKDAHTLEYWVEDDNISAMFIEAFEYLASRGEPVFNGWTYYWTPDTKFSMNRRIIIPFFHNGKIVGYVGRTFVSDQRLSKYYGIQPKDYMFNQDKLESESERIILVEGILDAVAIKGIASLGNRLSDKQVNLLKASNKEIILVPDRNKAGNELVEQAIEHSWSVSIPHWDRGVDDCAAATNKYGRLYTLKTIFESVMQDKNTIRMKFGASRL